MWTYRCYDDGKKPNLWQRWYDANPDYQGRHDAVFDTLESLPYWKEPYSKYLNNDERIIEVRLTGKVKHRILGFYGTKKQEFIVVATCNHKGKVYDPPDAPARAVKRKKEIERGERNAIVCTRPLLRPN